jgi:ketosteroid isomerase-like protein
MSNANTAIIQDVYGKFGQGDLAGILAALDADVRWEFVGRRSDYPLFGVRTGLAGVQEFFQAMAENEDITEFAPREFHASADKVFVLGHAGYTLKKTGKTAATDWVHVFTLKDGKIASFQEFGDTAQIAAAYKG